MPDPRPKPLRPGSKNTNRAAGMRRGSLMAEREKEKLGAPKTNSGKQRVARGVDTPELALARQHWSRFKKSIRKRPSLVNFYDHMIQWVDRSPTAKGHFHYRAPDGGQLCPFWLTD
jgi:hypothetical protein